jgi:hypothetical protein
MPTITATTVLNAPPDHVWTLLRDFAGIGGWHPFLPPVRVEGGPADRVGAVRVFVTPQGEHRERLLALDDLARSTTFRFDDSAGLPVRDYVSTLSVMAAGDGTLVTWSSRYDCDAADEPAVVAQVRDGILRPGLAALTGRFAAAEVTA